MLSIVIEVADSTLVSDRREKMTLYAAAGIPEYWIVNLSEQIIERHTLPSGDLYTNRTIIQDGAAVELEQFEASFPSTEILLRP